MGTSDRRGGVEVSADGVGPGQGLWGQPRRPRPQRALTAKRNRLDWELAHLTAAVSAGGPLKTLVSAIRTAERQAEQLNGELESLDGRHALTRNDRGRVTQDLRARLDDWRDLLRRHVPQARQILRKLFVDRVMFTPRIDHYEFAASWTLGKLVSGVVDLPQGMASPTGPESNFSMPSMSEVVEWMERLETLRQTDLYGAA